MNKRDEDKSNIEENISLDGYNFQLVEKGISGNVLIDNCVRISKRCITFSNNFSIMFKGFYGCEIFFDKVKKAIALKPSKNRMRAYSMGGKKRMLNIHSNTVQTLINSLGAFGTFEAEVMKGMVIVKLNKRLK